MDQNDISRIDRAVADNIKDIERSFGPHAGIVQDFIVFITRKIKVDLFGYTRFTLTDFCRESGRNRQDLAIIHPDFAKGKRKPPEFHGFRFQTVFDYALYLMLERNIIFSSHYTFIENDETIVLKTFSILKDVRLNPDRGKKEIKIYDNTYFGRLTDRFSKALRRYYTLDPDSYRLVGKGRGGDGRKKTLIYLSKARHILLSQNQNQAVIPIDRIADIAGINVCKTFHKKQSICRVLRYIQLKGNFPFEFEFVSNRSNYQYFIQLTFQLDKKQLISIMNEHRFYYTVLGNLRVCFQSLKYHQVTSDKDPFQSWLANTEKDIGLKANILVNAFYRVYNMKVSEGYAAELVRSGNLLAPVT